MGEHPGPPLRVLLLSSGNGAAAQLAAGLLRDFGGSRVVVLDATTEPADLDPRAAQALRELGIADAGWSPRPLADFEGERLDYAITVCATGCRT